MFGSFKNWNIIRLSHKETSNEEIDKIYQVLLDSISGKMAELVQTDKWGSIDATDTTTMVYYVIKLMSEPYTIQ